MSPTIATSKGGNGNTMRASSTVHDRAIASVMTVTSHSSRDHPPATGLVDSNCYEEAICSICFFR
jgi:hypothetical protein